MAPSIFKAFFGILFLSALFLHPAAEAKTTNTSNPTEIKQALQDLQSSLTQISAYKVKKATAQGDLETKIVIGNDRMTTSNEADMDGAILENYQAAAHDDISYLREHWARLSASEKALVNQDKWDLNDPG